MHTEKDPTKISGFEKYDQLFDGVNTNHPQRQGLLEAEYAQAITDARTVSTEVEIDGEVVEVPQLMPIEALEWLNTDFYERHFPEEVAAGRLLNFTDVPGVKPSDKVLEAIMGLAHSEGVLVFDTPSSDPEAQARILTMLDALGIMYEQPELLGTQTYFAGQVELVKAEAQNDIAPVSLMDTYQRRLAEGRVPESDFTDGTTLQTIIDSVRAADLRRIYYDAYQVLNDHPCKQGLDPDEFHQILTQDEKMGKLVYTSGGEIETLCLVENNLKKLSWVNDKFYQKTYPLRHKNGQIVWFPGIATDPDKQGASNSQTMINLMAELAEEGGNAFVGVFDFCDVNTAFLAEVFEQWINAAPQTRISLKPIADQKYWALRLSA